MVRVASLLLGLAISATAAADQPNAEQQGVDFAREIQPIFARRCYKCHGPNVQEGGLQLSSRKAALAELDSGDRAVVPGDVEASGILARVRSQDESDRMPPEGKPLSPEQTARIQQWIKAGASWANHWAFEALRRPAVPKPKNAAWVRNPIDAFVLDRLEAAGLTPAPPADRVVLLRRAYYDLIGLPPTPAQVDAFLADKSPKAYEHVVDRLLKSPQYGEKWARHWLDLVRYAETNGYERDSRKDLIWKYRDYVIRAFNQDKPYDRFVLEQLAGDELPDKTGDSVTATGFYRLGIWDDEPANRPLARYDYLDDILRTTGETFLGMTIGCARCHDHKIDPVAQKDYYSMLSFFSDISPHGKGNANHVRISAESDRPAFEKRVAERRRREQSLAEQIAAVESDFLTRLAKKHPDLKIRPGKSSTPPEESAASGEELGASGEQRGGQRGGQRGVVVLADSIKSGNEWEYTTDKPADDWFEIAFDDGNWKKSQGGFGARGTPGAVVRTQWRSRDVWLRKDFGLTEIPAGLVLNIHHDEDAQVYLNGKQIATFTGYVTDYKRVDVSAASLDVLQTGRNTLAIHCRQTGGGQYIDAGLIADFSVPPTVGLVGKYGMEIIGREKLERWRQLRRELTQSQSEKLEPKTEFVMAVAERGRNKTWILGRGLPAMQGDEVGPAFPQILDPPAADVPAQYATGQTSGKRRVLAQWVASGDNPVTSRVIVNRIWQHHFGRGIVRTTSDFGFQGAPPSHPDLLDWLATEFVSEGWRMKAFHKLIMMSATYQMSSRNNLAALAKDPANDLFWRFNMRRLTAEELRDSILAVSGALNPKMYGTSIYPPLPPEVLATASRPDAAWGRSSDEESARRTIYVHVKRSLRPPMLANFDSPNTDSACAVRMSTTVPTQALGMLNSKFMSDQAAKLAARLQREHPDDIKAQVARAIRLTAGRRPQEDEVRGDVAYVDQIIAKENLSPSAALRHYCLLILNTNEFVYLD